TNGGGMYIEIDGQSEITLENTTFIECESKNQTSGVISSGYGGGIFIQISNWINTSNGINLGEVEYIQCRSESSGDGLFVIMNELRELCRLGNPQGQFVRSKGYIEGLINNSLLMGYIGDINSFNNATDVQLIQSIYSLEFLWRDVNKECQYGNGGCIKSIINSGQMTINNTEIIKCSGANGGGIYGIVTGGGIISISNSSFYECSNQFGNGGAVYIELSYSQLFLYGEVLFSQCIAKKSSSILPPTGYGGGLFLFVHGNIDITKNDVNLKAAKYFMNEAQNLGHNLFTVMRKVKEWCRQGVAGEFVKGNYSDLISDQAELEGITEVQNFFQLNDTEIELQSQYLEVYWSIPEIWHVLFHESGSAFGSGIGIDQEQCGHNDDPCKTIDYTVKLISFKKLGNINGFIEVKKIGITSDGFELLNIYQFSKSIHNCDELLIMKELYGMKGEMKDQAQLIIKKNNDDQKEIGQFGWLCEIDGIKLGIYGIDLITYQSTLLIPIIYISGSGSILKLVSVRIIGIDMQFSGSTQGIVYINDDTKNLLFQSCTFQDINIIGQGGNVIRIGNSSFSQSSQAIINDTTFKNINSKGDSNQRGGAAVFASIKSGGILNVFQSKFESVKCSGGYGGSIYAILESSGQFIIDQETSFIKCESVAEINKGGRGGSIYLYLPENSQQNFMIYMSTIFLDNKASKYGRDMFIFCRDVYKLHIEDKLLIDVFSNQYDRSNALFGTEYANESELIRPQFIDYDLLNFIQPYLNDTLFIRSKKYWRVDGQICGRILIPCETLHYGSTRVLTPEWTDESVKLISISKKKVKHTFIIVEGLVISKQFQSESDIVVLRGALQNETISGINRPQVTFVDFGQIICSDLAKWQILGQSELNGVDQQFSIQRLELYLPEKNNAQSIIKILGSQESQIRGRKVEIKIQDCILYQENITSPIISSSFLKTEPFITSKIHVTLEEINAQSIYLNNTALIELKCEPEIVSLENILNIIKSNFTNISNCSTSSSSQSSTNIAPDDITLASATPFEPLWLREKEIGIEGSGLIVLYDSTSPSIKAGGIQFVDINIDHQTINLKAGRFSSQTIQLQEQELIFNGQGDNESSIIQKNTSQILLNIENSQVTLSGLTVELWGAKASLIRSKGNGMSLINGLIVNGRLEGAFVQGSIFEFISGDLSLIDIKIKDVNIIGNNQGKISENQIREKMKGLIEMKENAQLLYIEKFFITNINIEQSENNNKWSSIIMNAGHLKLRDGTFLGEAYTSGGSAIRAYPTGPSTIDVEGVVFKGQGGGTGTNGGAVYIDMRYNNVSISFKRCVFIGNKADHGSNVFIAYSSPSQRVGRSSFIGCTSIAGNSHESDVSVCYSIGDNYDEIFIDERDLIHSSWNRQKSECVVRFIAKYDNLSFDSNIKCGSPSYPCDSFASLIQYITLENETIDGSSGRAETIVFNIGNFAVHLIDLKYTRSDVVNIVGCEQEKTNLITKINSQNFMIYGKEGQNVIIERLTLSIQLMSPHVGFINIKGPQAGLVMQDVRPQFLFKIEGFVLLRDVIFDHIYLRTGQILQLTGLRRTAGDKRMEWLGKTSIGLDNLSLHLGGQNAKGGLIHMTTKKLGI
ncbi:MAG: hypothetical protein EZS28_007063, partial [Streblomastix strix]